MGRPIQVALPASHTLTVTADAVSAGSVRRLPQSGDATQYAFVAVAVSSSVTIGPFSLPRNYEIVSEPGTLSYVIGESEANETSAELAGTLNDETGTGPAVFANAPTLAAPLITPPTANAAVDGAIAIRPGTVVFSKAGVAAMTLAAPTAGQENIEMVFTAGTANAHTITATGLIQDGVTGGAKNLATFAAFVGSSLTLKAVNLKWHVLSLNAVVIS